MSIDAFDPEILQDFLTESGELLEQLEGDLVALEETPADTELINQVFRRCTRSRAARRSWR